MSNEAIAGLAGLPELLLGLAKAAGDLDQEMCNNALATLQKYAELIPILKESLGDSFDSKVALQLLDTLIPKTLRVSLAEILVRGDISVRQNIEVGGGITAGFAPYVALTLSGAYHRETFEGWGSEVRVSLAAVPTDPELVAELIRRAQEREAKDPAKLSEYLSDVYPVITELFGKPATSPVTN